MERIKHQKSPGEIALTLADHKAKRQSTPTLDCSICEQIGGSVVHRKLACSL
jgi:hypothetical protein